MVERNPSPLHLLINISGLSSVVTVRRQCGEREENVRIFLVQEQLDKILGFILYGKAVYQDTNPLGQAALTPVL